MSKEKGLQMGDTVVQIHTGFIGTVTAITHYLGGRVQLRVTPKTNLEKFTPAQWHDLQDVAIVQVKQEHVEPTDQELQKSSTDDKEHPRGKSPKK